MTLPDDNQSLLYIPPGLEQAFELERMVNEPVRLFILGILDGADEVSFSRLTSFTKLTRGHLSAQIAKLEEAGYVTVHKRFKGKIPTTSYTITSAGHEALAQEEQRLNAILEGLQNQKKKRRENQTKNALAKQNPPEPFPSTS